jgi:two-component system chemotaxis sensor kinase CheA
LKDIQQKLLATFQMEHRDHVEQIRSLLAIIAKTEAPPERAGLEEVFRRAHSLKGAARAVDLRPIEELAHRLETLFSRVLKGTCVLDKDVTRVVQQVLDASEDCIGATPANQPAETLGAALRAIGNVLGIETPGIEVKATATAEAADVQPRDAQTHVPITSFQPLEMVRISAENFDGLFRTAGSLVAESQRRDHVAEELDQLARDLALMEKEGEQLRRIAEALGNSEASREHSRLTSLLGATLGAIGQRTRSLSRKARTTRRLQQRRTWDLRQLGKQLQQDVSQARLVPAESLLEGYRRMMRDLARDENREIEFRATSASVNADRRVLEALKDPIMHLLRNAVSHGIESVSERTGKAKKPAGLVTLRIETDGQRLTVTIEDDGRGVDLALVAEVAAREGILSGAAATAGSAQELTRILFRPGFSTSTAVTSLSGRGMGLSVVYEAVRRLQGDVSLQPAPGGGTTISLSVPLSIASHRLVIVDCGKQAFAIPVLGVERLLRIKRSSVETAEGRPVTVFNGKQVPLTTIHALLDLENSSDQDVGQSARKDTDTLQVVVLRAFSPDKTGGQRVGLVVDAVVREADAVIQDLAWAGGDEGGIASGVVLDDGGIAFVVNPMQLLENAIRAAGHDASRRPAVSFARPSDTTSAEPGAGAAFSNILVVDDSMTTRALEKSILEAHGYQVRIAVDGLDALARLRQEAADLVIADIEMPRLNGFGLIEAMKKDPKLENIPVIIVSSIERREDQERGLALGADAYIVKGKFDQQELLAAIRQII